MMDYLDDRKAGKHVSNGNDDSQAMLLPLASQSAQLR